MIRAAAELRARTDAWRAAGQHVGFVATLGGIHDGHRSLVRRARDERDRVVASIYLNPHQFTSASDLERYPHDQERDLAALEAARVDAAWVPSNEEVYPPGLTLVHPDPGPLGSLLEGASRPGHFDAVLTVVHRLLDVVGPCTTYFGEKDAQQLFLVQRMVRELLLPVEVVPCPTVREPDGLALSSRNALLGSEEREQAGCLFLALAEAAELARSGERDARVVVATMAREIGATPLARLDYATVVDEATFEPLDRIERPARALVAAGFPSARLIDNLLLPEPP